MNKLLKFLISAGLMKISEGYIKKWNDKGNVGMLEYALKSESYRIRKNAINGLCENDSKKSITLIVNAIDDEIRQVSFEAISTIGKLGFEKEYKEKIEEKLKFWQKKEQKEKEALQQFKTKKAAKEYKWKRSSKETFENAKQMLKKPMIGGKWF